MKNLFGLLVILFFFVSCSENEGDLVINFKAEYDGNTFLMFDELPYGDATLKITDSDFFISNIEITDDQNEVISFDKIDFIDFTNTNVVTDPDSKDRGIDVALGKIPNGNYTKIKFGIGLDANQNKSVPEDFSSDHVLSTNSHYWSVWNSYIFMKFQGLYADASTDDIGFVFHIGNDELYREVEIPINLTVSEGKNIIGLSLDHKNLLQDGDQLFDIPSSPSNHQPMLDGPMYMIVNNFVNSFYKN